jgi:ATP-binding cassette, subfamily B (MDR/TAP), member 1
VSKYPAIGLVSLLLRLAKYDSFSVIFAVLVAAQSLTQIAPQGIAISKAAAAARELFLIIDRESKIDPLSSSGETIPDLTGEIQLRNVRFAYPTRKAVQVLRGLDLDVPAGKTTALVGASGSGKSTVFGLLERWYQASEGSVITLDGKPIENLNLKWLRTRIRLVQQVSSLNCVTHLSRRSMMSFLLTRTQEPTIFRGTIYQNVVDGLTGTEICDLSDTHKKRMVTEACKAAYAHDFVTALPNVSLTHVSQAIIVKPQTSYKPSVGLRHVYWRAWCLAVRRPKAAHRHCTKHHFQPSRPLA